MTRGRRQRRRDGRGVALVTVLMVTTIAAALALGMLARHQMTLVRTDLAVQRLQARTLALAGESYARELLWQDAEQDRQEGELYDGLDEAWAAPDASFPLDDGGRIEVRIDDLQARINVRMTRRDEVRIEILRRLLGQAGGDPARVDAIVDWQDIDQDVAGFGAEDGVYLLRDPPYRAGNAPVADPTELRLVDGIDDETWRRIGPLLGALPVEDAAVNVNTAHGAVLAAIGGDGATATLAEPAGRHYPSVADFVAEQATFAASQNLLAVRSAFFAVSVRAEHGRAVALLRSVVHRNLDDGSTTVLQRIEGVPFAIVDPGTGTDDADDPPARR